MYATVTDLPKVEGQNLQNEEGPDIVKLDLGGQIGKLNVGLTIPYKKTAAIITPNDDQSA